MPSDVQGGGSHPSNPNDMRDLRANLRVLVGLKLAHNTLAETMLSGDGNSTATLGVTLGFSRTISATLAVTVPYSWAST
jgi:hypothetical protein